MKYGLFFCSALLAGAACMLPASASTIAAGVPARSDVRDLGRAAPATPVTLALTIRYRHANELDGLIDAQSDPASPLYGRYLTNAQFNAYFAPTTSDYARVATALGRAGFRITQTYPNRTLIGAIAPAATVERYFATQIHAVAQTGHGVRYANAKPAVLPAELDGTVDTVVGFDNLVKAKFLSQTSPRTGTQVLPAVGGPLRGPDGGFGPIAIANGFDFPVQHGFDGTGHAVANVAGNVADSDVNAFYAYFGIKRTGTINRTIIEGSGTTNPSDPAVAEALLDVEDMGSLAPGATIDLYILENPVDAPGEAAYNKIVSDNLVDAVNSSFGTCETSDPAYAQAAAKIIAQGLVKGITWSASAGDGGNGECSNGPKGQLVPAALARFIGVGGTSLHVDANGNYVSESAWNGSGGGYSAVIPLPKYQSKLTTALSKTLRNVPDVAFPADPSTGFSYYAGGRFAGPIGGTSWSSPTFVALQAETNQIKGKREGFVNQKIYNIFYKSKYAAFHDITTGSNGNPAGPGYDNVTGIGSPIGFLFAGRE